MNNVPHWEWLMVIYFVLVAIPVMVAHTWQKKRLLKDKSVRNILIYIATVVGTAFLMHFFTMWLYFKFLFTDKP